VKLVVAFALLPSVAFSAPAPHIALSVEADAPLSKKSAFLLDKSERPERRAERPPRAVAERVVTLRNVWTHESLPVTVEPSGKRSAPAPFDQLVRCHFTNQATEMDARLFDVVMRAATQFKSASIDIVSGFRAPKYQLMLRKKGHEVARDSEHPRGHAVDFRVPAVPTKVLLRFVRSLRLGGVGYYPESRFVHADVGRVRFWRGH
jgi:uncharacterized protein YcbK (DUF882 family)